MATAETVARNTPTGQRPESALIRGGQPEATSPSEQWGVKLPKDVSVNIFRHPRLEDWKNVSVVEIGWPIEGKAESRVRVQLYPRGREIIITDVDRPDHWGPDTRPAKDQTDEYKVGLATALETVADPSYSNPLNNEPYAAPRKIRLSALTGPAAEAAASLKPPPGITSSHRLEYSGIDPAASLIDTIRLQGRLSSEFIVDREQFRGVGSTAVQINVAAAQPRQMPPPIPGSIYV